MSDWNGRANGTARPAVLVLEFWFGLQELKFSENRIQKQRFCSASGLRSSQNRSENKFPENRILKQCMVPWGSCFPRTWTSHNKGNLSKARWKRRSKQKLRKTFRRLLLLVDSSKFWVPSRVPKIDQILDIVRFPRSQKNGDAGVASFSIFDAKPAATNFFIDCSLMWVSQIDFFWFRWLEMARFVSNRANP